MRAFSFALGLGLLWIAGCATKAPVGPPRPVVPIENVRLYSSPPAGCEVIGSIMAVRGGTLELNREAALMDLRRRASELGANGVLITRLEILPRPGARLGTTESLDFFAGNAPGGMSRAYGKAIIVP